MTRYLINSFITILLLHRELLLYYIETRAQKVKLEMKDKICLHIFPSPYVSALLLALFPPFPSPSLHPPLLHSALSLCLSPLPPLPLIPSPPTEQTHLQDEYEATLCTPFQAAARGFIDDIIRPSETRLRICEDLEILQTKKQENPWKKHGNIPL